MEAESIFAIGEISDSAVGDLVLGGGDEVRREPRRELRPVRGRSWWCHHDGSYDDDDNLSKEHFIYRVNHVQMNGWFSLLTIVAWLYALLLIFIVGMQVFDHIHARHHVILISYEIAYPMFLVVVSYRQLLRHFVALALAWTAVSGLNVYFNYTFISVLAACSEEELCSHDQLRYVWYLSLFVGLSVLDLLILIIYVRVIPIVMHVDQYFNGADIENYVQQLAYIAGQTHPRHVRTVYEKALRLRNTTHHRPPQEQPPPTSGGGGGEYDDVLLCTTHHTLKSLTLRVPKR